MTAGTTPPVRILLVDDEPPILRSLIRLLGFDGYDLVTAGSATDALPLLSQDTAVILTDFDLGGIGGVELLREARLRSPDTSRILFSGHIDLELLRAAVNGGEVYRFITKPWNDDELLQAVRQGVERHHLLRQNRTLAERAETQNSRLKHFNAELEQMVGERTAALELRNHALGLSQEVLDGLPVAVIGIAPDGQVALTNALARRLFPGLLAGETPADGSVPLWEWSREALELGNELVVEGALGRMRIEVMALGDRGVLMTVIPLQAALPAAVLPPEDPA